MTDLLDDWATWSAQLQSIDLGALDEVPGAVLHAPITYPRKVLCTGSNYFDHAKEMGSGTPSSTDEPFFFLKPPTTTIIGPGATIPLPDGVDGRLDWEVELGVVIGQRCKGVTRERALDVVAGYVVAVDISARALFARPDAALLSFTYDWFRHKALDGFCPIGPGLVPSWLVGDAGQLDIALSVNGQVKQASNTREQVIDVAGLIASASRFVTLEPGDLILTGTPAGVGMPRGEFLVAGDEIVAEIAGVGRLANRVG
ncbi:hypothetical protein BH11ACT4_BH11ACT4_18770 [soil metagenome]